MIRDFALQLLRRLQTRPEGKDKEPQTNGDAGEGHEENMEDGQLPQEDILQTPYLPEQLELPAQKEQVLQHLELLFALSTRVPEFLDEYVLLRHTPIFYVLNLPGCLRPMAVWTRACKKRYSNL